ncbi:MAG: DUF1800 domain-containing protein [Planctomycetes bacterium]|nr:DUF1800 domain-containing protein [Planctomycetota bacterium]
MHFTARTLLTPLTVGLLCVAGPARAATGPVAADPVALAEAGPRWDARAAEHLLNRAGFGGSQADVDKLVKLGLAGAVDSFFHASAAVPMPDVLGEATLHGGLDTPEERLQMVTERREGNTGLQPELIVSLNRYCDWWVERMVKSEDPLRDRMTIFWHGHFVSSVKDVGNAHDMIRQNQFLRANALGRFEPLVRGIGRDPAMLRYLNNDTNVKGHPNENWARELMELFSLGDGNYTESDIKEAARAFTGWSRDGFDFEYKRLDHDFGDKRVLSVNGNFDGDAIIDIILTQPACGHFMAQKLLAYFEGVQPTEARTEDYAEFLRKNQYDIGKLLRRLFQDPAFYRDEVVGTRVAAPVEYLVGAARRLHIDPPGQMVLNAGDVLGQRLFWPPSVKGWEEGLAWITTSSMMQRSNMVGVLLGLVDVRALMHDEEFSTGDPMAAKAKTASRTNGFNHLYHIQQMGWTPSVALAERARSALAAGGKQVGDEALTRWFADELLAIPYQPETTREPYEWLKAQRTQAGIAEGELLQQPAAAEPILRGLAHLILSLPEAQLN